MTQSLLDLRVRLATKPLAMSSDAMLRVSALLAGGRFEAPPIASRRIAAAGRGGPRGTPAGRAAVIPVLGVLTQHPSFLEALGLGTSCATIKVQLRAALSDPGVDRIVLDLDSPGGEVSGIQELATEIRANRLTKPIIGFANSMAASAAYWIGSACTEFYAAPSAQVGSIGCIAQHDDMSGALEIAGVKVTVIHAGAFKSEGSQFEPLTNAARAEMQSMVNSYGADFERAVALGRNVSVDTVRSKFGQGRMFRAKDATRLRMVDGVATLADVTSGRTKASITADAYAGLPRSLANAMRDLDLLQ